MSDSTVIANLVAFLVQVAEAQGVPRAAMLSRAHLTDAMLTDPDGRIPFEQLMAVWDVLAESPGFEGLGVRLGSLPFTHQIGVLGWMMAQCATLRDATETMARYGRLLSDVFTPRMTEDRRAGLAVWTQALEPRYVRLRQPQEWAMTTCLHTTRQLTGIEWQVREAAVQHPRPTGPDLLSEALGIAVKYGAPAGRLALEIACLDAPVRAANPTLKSYLERTAQRHLDQLPSTSAASLQGRVRGRIAEALARAVPTQASVAQQLALSERTLQRRLAEEGTSFATLLDETRREMAVLHLGEPTLAVYEVAVLLGYSETSAFHRAFRRWTGVTPQAYRANASQR